MDKSYKVGMISLGCPKNQVDGEVLLAKLADAGFKIVNTIEDSDIMIVNTCGFIEAAKTEAIETILEVAEYKNAGIISAIVVTGCLAERYKDDVLSELPEVDAVVGIGANSDIVKVCQKALCGISTANFPNKCYLPLNEKRMLSTPPHWAYLKIAEGCDNRCAFCAIPGIRGKFRSRPMDEVIAEAKTLASKGIKEVILIAQDTTKYGQDIYGEYKLAALLKELVKIDGIEWIRLYYCYPQRITDELIEVIRDNEKICSYIDVPLQHSDATVLRNMRRVGTGEDYKALIAKMRKEIPDLALRTTLMVGFPGETDEQFENLCAFIKDVKFDRMGCFAFSPEEDTPAYDMDNQLDDDVKNHRQEILMDLQYGISESLNKSRVGKTYKVIVDSVKDNVCVGRSYMDSPEIDTGITFSSTPDIKIGDFVNVKITDVDGYDLVGEIVK
ncbi:MAG: 30S ribosomal protein S12 methylthiotransferase RimO [Oscillospiraceae bacterium]|nr:30S ribosomal protein S12 methylthiotransferase RimO [Oscillospiraceae bacterium]